MNKSITLKMLKVSGLERAPWNPRSEEELAWDNEKMAELIASVKASGVTQSVAVWDRGDEGMLVIAGNRRLEASKAANLDLIPAIVYTGIGEAEAHEITRTENEIRSNIDPLRDAVLIGEMLEKGLNQKTIAAHFAMSEAMVCRRVKLLGLVDEIRQVVNSSKNFATDALEKIALYPAETQRECLDEIKYAGSRNGIITWSSLKYAFTRKMRDLDEAKFDTSCCLKCPARTGAQPDLWDEMPNDGKLGSCTKHKCYERHLRDYFAGLVREKIGNGVEIVDGNAEGYDLYQVKNRPEFSERKSKKFAVAWWFLHYYSHEMQILWGPTLESFREIEKAEEEAEAAEAEARAKESAEEKAKREAEKAARERIQKESNSLRDAEYAAYNAITDHFESFGDKKVEDNLKKVVCKQLKKKTASIVANVMCEWATGFDSESGDVVTILEEYPALAKALEVTTKELKAYRDAEKVYAKFRKDNNL